MAEQQQPQGGLPPTQTNAAQPDPALLSSAPGLALALAGGYPFGMGAQMPLESPLFLPVMTVSLTGQGPFDHLHPQQLLQLSDVLVCLSGGAVPDNGDSAPHSTVVPGQRSSPPGCGWWPGR